MSINRRHCLANNIEPVHLFPIYEYEENKFYQKNNLVDLDYFIYSQTSVTNAKELRLFLLDYYKNIMILVNSQPTNRKQLQLNKTIIEEIKYLKEHEQVKLKILYKNNGKFRDLNVHYRLNNIQKYFLEQYNLWNQYYEYDTAIISNKLKEDENYNIFLNLFIKNLEKNKFLNFIKNSKGINSYLKGHIFNYIEFLNKNKSNEGFKNDENNFYETSATILFRELLSYKNLRTILEQCIIYSKIYKDDFLEYLDKKIKKELESGNVEDFSHIARQMEEYYNNGYDLKDFNEDLGVYPDGLGIRKK